MGTKTFTPEEIKRVTDFILLLAQIDRKNKELKKLEAYDVIKLNPSVAFRE